MDLIGDSNEMNNNNNSVDLLPRHVRNKVLNALLNIFYRIVIILRQVGGGG